MQEVETTDDGEPWDQPSPNEALLRRFRGILPPGTWHGVYAPVNHAGNTWEGQAIVSRWPIQKTEVWDLERSGRKRRVALAAWLATPNGPLLFINTDHETSLVQTGPQDRARQVRSLLLRLVNHRDLPCILVGDFNTSGWLGMDAASEIAALRSSLGDIGFAPHSETFNETTFHSWPLSLSLDHMFGRRVTCSEWGVHPTEGSDHYVLWGRFEKLPSHQPMPRRPVQSSVRER
jgi:endonuclease/exonuclease/phosphatase family metal-dependent hydrolase